MNKFLLLLVISFFIFVPNTWATNDDDPTPPVGNVNLQISEHPDRPRSLFPEEITCCYTNGQMSFSSSMGIDCMTVEITDMATGNTGYYTVLNENDCIPVPLTQGSYMITCRTELNITYTGVLDIP